MSKVAPSPYSLKRLRELCVGIHEANIAFLLRTTLPEFPISVINDFFNGSKLNRPANRDDREWTDIVRLTLIAFSPSGSEPAQLRGKRVPRYKREYPFDPRPNRDDADGPGGLTLYPSKRTTPILADIAAALGVVSLSITNENWMGCYLANPFPLRSLRIAISARDHNSTLGRDGMDSISQCAISALASDLSRLTDTLPDSLEHLSLHVDGFKMSGGSLSRLKRLRSVQFYIEALGDSLDFSQNSALENLNLTIREGGEKGVKGFSSLPLLKSLSLIGNSKLQVESVQPLLERTMDSLILAGVAYPSEALSGFAPGTMILDGIKGLKRVAVTPEKDRAQNLLERSSPSVNDSWGAHGFSDGIKIAGCEDLTVASLKTFGSELSLSRCDSLLDIQIQMRGEKAKVKVSNCENLSMLDAIFAKTTETILLENLPSLAEAKLTTLPADNDTTHSPGYAANLGTKPGFQLRNTSLTRLPIFTGPWEGLSLVELLENEKMQTMAGVEFLPDLEEIRITNQAGMTALLPGDFAHKLPSVRVLTANKTSLSSPARFDAFPHLETLQLISCTVDSLEGVEAMECLSKVDLSSSSVKSLAPLAELPVLESVRVSGCESLRPKPPRVLLEGAELLAELARHAGPSCPSNGGKVPQKLTKIVQLIGVGSRSDVSQAVELIPVLTPEEQAKLVWGATLDPKTGWIRLPYLTKLREEQSRGIPQLRILEAVNTEDVRALLSSVSAIYLNRGRSDSLATMCFGKDRYESAGGVDDVLEEFSSLGSLPDLPNLTSISVSGLRMHQPLSHFSISGIEKFRRLTALLFSDVAQLEDLPSLRHATALQSLSLCGSPLKNLTEFGRHSSLTNLTLRCNLESLEGLENFPALETLQIQSTADISHLLEYAQGRRCRLAFHCDAGDDNAFGRVRFEFHPQD